MKGLWGALARRSRALAWRARALGGLRGGWIDWDTSILLGEDARIDLSRKAGIRGGGEVVLLDGARFEMKEHSAIMRRCDVVLREGARLSIGRNVYLGTNVNLRVDLDVSIGDDVHTGQFVSIIGGQYDFARRDARIFDGPIDARPVRVGAGAWIGAGAVLLPGVTVGEGAVIGAGSIVTRDVPPFAIAVGNPARVKGERK